jgi:hypothetical protein
MRIRRADMKIILVSSALALSVFCFLASGSAKAQEFFFPNAYSRPSEMVDGINDGARLNISRSNNAAAQRYHAGATSDFRHSR